MSRTSLSYLLGVCVSIQGLPLIVSLCCFREKEAGYEEFELPGGPGPAPGTEHYMPPEGIPEPVRPPMRPIDMYVRAECPCMPQRFTVAVLTCIGFIISFGMRCNMGMAKLKLEENTKMVCRKTTKTGSYLQIEHHYARQCRYWYNLQNEKKFERVLRVH